MNPKLIMRIKIMSTLLTALLILIMGCKSEEKQQEVVEMTSDENTFYQYNIWWGFVNKVFDGDLSVSELKKKGDIGLGSYTKLDGELIMLDGISYRVKEDGKVSVANDTDLIVYVDAAFFEPEFSFQINEASGYDSLREIINSKLPSPNQFYSIKVKGKFSYMQCGGLRRQEKPYTDGLDVLIPSRPVFEKTGIEGTMVGFYCPDFIGNINVAGYHFHFISEDKQFGGHAMSFEIDEVNVEVDPLLEYHFEVPSSEDFLNVSLDKEFQYETK